VRSPEEIPRVREGTAERSRQAMQRSQQVHFQDPHGHPALPLSPFPAPECSSR
jgi:hypothetical protein